MKKILIAFQLTEQKNNLEKYASNNVEPILVKSKALSEVPNFVTAVWVPKPHHWDSHGSLARPIWFSSITYMCHQKNGKIMCFCRLVERLVLVLSQVKCWTNIKIKCLCLQFMVNVLVIQTPKQVRLSLAITKNKWRHNGVTCHQIRLIE